MKTVGFLRGFAAVAALELSVLALPVVARAADDATMQDQTPAPVQAAATPAPDPAKPTPICTDRPGKVFSTCTLEPGHLQLETDLINGAFQRAGGVTTDTWLLINPTLKYGVTKTLDVEVNFSPLEMITTRDKFGNTSRASGVSDLYFRAKYNFFNTSDGNFSATLIPYVKAPTARSGIGNEAVEGGAALALSYKLTSQLTISTSPEVDAYKDAGGDGRHANMIQVLTLSYSLPHSVTVSGEVWGDWNYDPLGETHQYSADVSTAWGLNDYLQLDAGLNFGLNRETPGVQAYVGLSQKF